MANEDDSRRLPEETQPAGPTGNICDRVKKLQEKARHLGETLDRVEKTLEQAAGESER
jgi:DNA anti-recombination protein RmuC